jgi:hypothetical protein
MNKWIGPAVGGVALIVGLANLVALQGVSGRLDALAESQHARVQGDAEPERRSHRSGPIRERRGRSADFAQGGQERAARDVSPGATPLTVDLDDPVVVEELTARLADQMKVRELGEREVRHQTFMDEAGEEVRRFAEERDWSDRTTTDVIDEVQARMDSWHSLRTDMHEGVVSRYDGRREMEALSEESDAKLLSLMGQEDLDALSDSVLPGRGRGGRGGPPRR